MKIVFMGTPDFAVPCLDILVKNGYDVVGVVTVPDKPAGRGQQVQQSPVKKYAIEHNLKVLQPEKLKAPEFIEELKSLATKWYKKPAEQAKILKALNTLSVKSVWFENKKVKASVPEYLN